MASRSPRLGSRRDRLAIHNEDFSGTAALAGRGWTWYNAATVDVETFNGSSFSCSSTTGGAPGAHWWSAAGDERRGNFLHRDSLVTGAFDLRARVEVRDTAGTASPSTAANEWRFAGIAVHDPDRVTSFNYVHTMLGSDPDGANRIEWKTTDGNTSTWASVPGAAPLDYDLRIVRTSADLQVFVISYRRTDAGEDLWSDSGWTTLQTIDRSDNTAPTRFASADAVAMPASVQVGIVPGYAGPQSSLDIQMETLQFGVRSRGA